MKITSLITIIAYLILLSYGVIVYAIFNNSISYPIPDNVNSWSYSITAKDTGLLIYHENTPKIDKSLLNDDCSLLLIKLIYNNSFDFNLFRKLWVKASKELDPKAIGCIIYVQYLLNKPIELPIDEDQLLQLIYESRDAVQTNIFSSGEFL